MIIGHKKQWQILTQKNKYHALLFSGQESLGKKKVAIEFAKFLKCSQKEPCHKCPECLAIEKKTSSDFILLEEDSEIKISQIREIKRRMFLSTDSIKITIVDKAHLMNKNSQNCFLKILEEPRKNTIFILVTEYPELLLPTVLSRVQQIKFFPVKNEKIKDYIKNERIVSLSLNRPGRAIRLSLEPEKIQEYEKNVKDFERIRSSLMKDRFKEAKSISQKNLEEIFFVWLFYLRKMFLKYCQEGKDYSKIKNNIKNLQKISSLVERTNVNKKLATELLLIKLK